MRTILLLLLFGSYNVVCAQAYKIKYYHTRPYRAYRPKTNDDLLKKMPPDFLPRLEKMLKHEAHRITVFFLVNANGKSQCSAQYTILDGEKDNDPRRLDGYGVFYKDFAKGYYVHVGEFIGRNTAVREHFSEIFNWKIDQNRDTTIYGISCKRATTRYDGDSVVAWFAPSIPIMDGPMYYAGLPGLILRTETIFGITEVADIQVIKNNNEEIVIPEKKKYISFKEMKESRTLTVKAKRIKKKE